MKQYILITGLTLIFIMGVAQSQLQERVVKDGITYYLEADQYGILNESFASMRGYSCDFMRDGDRERLCYIKVETSVIPVHYIDSWNGVETAKMIKPLNKDIRADISIIKKDALTEFSVNVAQEQPNIFYRLIVVDSKGLKDKSLVSTASAKYAIDLEAMKA